MSNREQLAGIARQALSDHETQNAWESAAFGPRSALVCNSSTRRHQVLQRGPGATSSSTSVLVLDRDSSFGLRELALAVAAAVALIATLLGQGDSPSAPTSLGELLALIDSGNTLSAQQSKQLQQQLPSELSKGYLRSAWNDPQLWESLELELPDRARAVASNWARLIEPRGGIDNSRPTFEFEYGGLPTGQLELVLQLSNGEMHHWPVEPTLGVQRLAPHFEQGLTPGIRGAWTLKQQVGNSPPLTPARFHIVDATTAKLGPHALGLIDEEKALLRAAVLLERGSSSAALAALEVIRSSRKTLNPSIRRRARLLRAVAYSIRGEETRFSELVPGL